jgi:hypothetical protein
MPKRRARVYPSPVEPAGTSNRQENEEARLAAILVLQIGKIDVRIRGFDWTMLQDFRLDVEAEDLLKW